MPFREEEDLVATCPSCLQEGGHYVVERRSQVPTLQNTTLATRQAAVDFPTGEITLALCASCGFVWNESFDEDAILYDENYNNDVSSSDYYNEHLESRVASILESVPAGQPIHYVEIGCGDADFMRRILRNSGGRVKSAVGFDPAYAGALDGVEGVTIHRRYFDDGCRSLIPEAANVICTRHTIEHVSKPFPFAEMLSGLVTRSDQNLFVETPTVDWIFENNAFYDIFYEHCSLFNPGSIAALFATFGLSGHTDLVYGGQYMWAQYSLNGQSEVGTPDPVPTRQKAFGYALGLEEVIADWDTRLKAGGYRKCGIWGAASKGVTFSLVMRQKDCEIDFAIDLNKQKQGCFIPRTGIEIQAPETVDLNDDDLVIVMNPNYLSEIKTYLATMGCNPTVLPM